MSPAANIKRVEVLHDLNQAIREFSQELTDKLRAVQGEINVVLEWLAERERHWRNEVQRCTAELHRAELAYAACMTQLSNARDLRSTCSGEAAAVSAAKRALAEAEAQLRNVLSWRREVENRVSAYIGQATRIQRTANTTLPQASTFLSLKSRDLGDYRQLQLPSTVNVIGNRGAAYEKAKQEMMLHALDDPRVGRDIKGWVRNEIRRIESGQANRMRMPGIGRYSPHVPVLDAGHRIHDVHHWSNLRFEDVWTNRTRYQRALRLGLADRIR